jgi:hypothetical protein
MSPCELKLILADVYAGEGLYEAGLNLGINGYELDVSLTESMRQLAYDIHLISVRAEDEIRKMEYDYE